jgi:hypothetical protein
VLVNKLQFNNFYGKKLYIPLIGALSEILESVKKIDDNNENRIRKIFIR